MKEWYYSSSGERQGPVTEDQLKSMILKGEVGTEELAWQEGMTDWEPISKIAEFASESAAGPTPAAPTPAPTSDLTSAPVPAATPYQTPGASLTSTADPTPGKDLPTYLWQSIVVTLLCCLPFGVVAIVYASKVEGLKASGDLAAARAASNSAKLWVNLSAGSILLLIVISIIMNLLGFVMFEPTSSMP